MFIQSLTTSTLFVVLSTMLVSSYVKDVVSSPTTPNITDTPSVLERYADSEFLNYENCTPVNSSIINVTIYLPCQYRRILYNDVKNNKSESASLQHFDNTTDYKYNNSLQFCASIQNMTSNRTLFKRFNDSFQNSALCQLICTKNIDFALWNFCRLVAYLRFGNETKLRQDVISQADNKNQPKPSNTQSKNATANVINRDTPDSQVTREQAVAKPQLPTKEDESHLFTYFFVISGLCVVIVLVIYNKKKILALMIEGRRRRNGKRGSSTAAYNRLKCDVEETVPVSPSSASASSLL